MALLCGPPATRTVTNASVGAWGGVTKQRSAVPRPALQSRVWTRDPSTYTVPPARDRPWTVTAVPPRSEPRVGESEAMRGTGDTGGRGTVVVVVGGRVVLVVLELLVVVGRVVVVV